ncbi:MAG: ribonuclease HII [Chlamydiae bacterium]|nr:ribonuclease HII [Chlamydiota bacterium]
MITLFHPCFEFESKARASGYKIIAGVDEAGRGPLAGPVVAAACILPEGFFLPGITDSKSLTSKQRKQLFKEIQSKEEIQYAIGIVDAQKIDQINILQATLLAMQIAVSNLSSSADFILVDGNQIPNWSYRSQAIVKGDSLSHSISMASVIAKETRDNIMDQYEAQYPGYGFGKHKGYGTKDHIEALTKMGPCPIHRKSFEPMKSMYINLSN